MNAYGPPEQITNTMINVLHDLGFDRWSRDWMRDNWKIWCVFHRRATQMQQSGRDYYSARTIAEAIRWETDLRETNSVFKVNNDIIPKLARLYNHLTGSEFFRLRKQRQAA